MTQSEISWHFPCFELILLGLNFLTCDNHTLYHAGNETLLSIWKNDEGQAHFGTKCCSSLFWSYFFFKAIYICFKRLPENKYENNVGVLIAQLIERPPGFRKVMGSNPIGNFFLGPTLMLHYFHINMCIANH